MYSFSHCDLWHAKVRKAFAQHAYASCALRPYLYALLVIALGGCESTQETLSGKRQVIMLEPRSLSGRGEKMHLAISGQKRVPLSKAIMLNTPSVTPTHFEIFGHAPTVNTQGILYWMDPKRTVRAFHLQAQKLVYQQDFIAPGVAQTTAPGGGVSVDLSEGTIFVSTHEGWLFAHSIHQNHTKKAPFHWQQRLMAPCYSNPLVLNLEGKTWVAVQTSAGVEVFNGQGTRLWHKDFLSKGVHMLADVQPTYFPRSKILVINTPSGEVWGLSIKTGLVLWTYHMADIAPTSGGFFASSPVAVDARSLREHQKNRSTFQGEAVAISSLNGYGVVLNALSGAAITDPIKGLWGGGRPYIQDTFVWNTCGAEISGSHIFGQNYWRHMLKAPLSDVIMHEGLLYVASNTHVIALYPESGEIARTIRLPEGVMGTPLKPIAHNGKLYVPFDSGQIVMCG